MTSFRLPAKLLAMAALMTMEHSIATPHAPEPGAMTRSATLKKFVPPEYPANALSSGITAKAELTIRISESGMASGFEEIKIAPPNASIEQALKDIVGQWVFKREVDARCEVQPYLGRLNIRFDIWNEVPAITYERVRVDHPEPPEVASLANAPLVSRAVTAAYPRAARRDNVEADVAVAIDFSGNTGKPQTIRATSADLLDGVNSPELEAIFQKAAESAMAIAEMQVKPGDADRSVRYCAVIEFRLRRRW